MKYVESTIMPQAIIRSGGEYILNFALERRDTEDYSVWRYLQAKTSADPTIALRNRIIIAIIRAKYMLDEELAISANVAVDNPADKYFAELAEFQAYRVFAKKLANVALILNRAQLEAKTVAELTEIGQLLDMAKRTNGFSAAKKSVKIDMLCDVLGVI